MHKQKGGKGNFLLPISYLLNCNTVEPGFSKLFEKQKMFSIYCQVFTIYHVVNAMIADFGKQQKVY